MNHSDSSTPCSKHFRSQHRATCRLYTVCCLPRLCSSSDLVCPHIARAIGVPTSRKRCSRMLWSLGAGAAAGAPLLSMAECACGGRSSTTVSTSTGTSVRLSRGAALVSVGARRCLQGTLTAAAAGTPDLQLLSASSHRPCWRESIPSLPWPSLPRRGLPNTVSTPSRLKAQPNSLCAM